MAPSFRVAPVSLVPSGARVRVYKNLNRPGLWSIQYKGKVVGYASEVWLRDVRQVISKPTLERMLSRNCRAVCAYLEGVLSDASFGGPVGYLRWSPFSDNGRGAKRRVVSEGCRQGFTYHPKGGADELMGGRTAHMVRFTFDGGNHARCDVFGGVR